LTAHEQWQPTGEPVSLEQPGGLVTLVEGSSFCLSGRGGDIKSDGAEGLFARDTRIVSQWELLIDGQRLEPLSVSVTEPFAATFVARLPPQPGQADSTLLVVRRRWVGSGMREDLELRNYGSSAQAHDIELRISSDLADVFAVKAGRVRDVPRVDAGQRRVHVVERGTGEQGVAGSSGLSWRISVPPKGAWSTCLEVTLAIRDRDVALQYRCGQAPAAARPSQRLAGWRRHAPVLTGGDERLLEAISTAVGDIGSLIIEDPTHPATPVVAAGAPWFMTLFGRDSLLTSYMALLVDPGLAVGVLQTLARLQGQRIDTSTEEQPGRILHEVRFGSTGAVDLDEGHIYFGTADATPLFVVLVGELSRWGVARAVIDELMPNVDRALNWIEQYGDRDDDGYVEYERFSPDGLDNQGWKDSWDGINSADGSLPTAPVALAEVQGYVYAAYLARAALADERGDERTATRYRDKAMLLRAAFNRDYWLPEQGWFAVALDGAKRPVDGLTSNMGHCLWSGIIDPEHAKEVAARLLSTEMFNGWGVRTLASSMARYNPLSYHNGSVWPHDTAIAAAGLMSYGFVEESCRLIDAVLDASVANGGRLPELYAGLDRLELPVPVAYPTSCSPQAWASAAPLLVLRTLLRFEPRLDLQRVALAPITLGRPIGTAEFTFGGNRLVIRVDGDGQVEVTGLAAGVALEHEPHPPAAAAHRSR
jgi:glycogen debranching enzyme